MSSTNNPYGEMATTSSPTNAPKQQAADASASTMLWGESNTAHDNDHRSAGCCACSPTVSSIMYGAILMFGAVFAFVSKFIAWKAQTSYAGFCAHVPIPLLQRLCVENQTIYRTCFTLSVFFLMMTIITSIPGMRSYHYTSWIGKISLIVCLYGLTSWLLPSSVFATYREIARYASVGFIIAQVLVLVDFAHNMHENLLEHMGDDESDSAKKAKGLYMLVGCSSIMASIAGVVVLYVKYAACTLHQTLISITLILSLIAFAISLSNWANKGLLPPALLSAYCILTTYQALVVNPSTSCSTASYDPTHPMPTWLLVVSLIVMCLQIGYTSVRAATNTQQFVDVSYKPRNNDALSSNDPYQYDTMDSESQQQQRPMSDEELNEANPPKHWLFHLVLVFASMYLAMVLTGWGNDDGSSIHNPEASVQSFWLKVVSVWLSFALYLWTLAAPKIFPDREFS